MIANIKSEFVFFRIFRISANDVSCQDPKSLQWYLKGGFGNPNTVTRKKILVTLIKHQSHPPMGICWDI